MRNEEEVKKGVAIAVSGGGFRATLFHIGTFWRLNELGYLKKLDRISSVSGGSILTGQLATRWNTLTFDEHGVATNFEDEVVTPLLKLCNKWLDVSTFTLGILNPFKSVAETLADQYDSNLYDCMKLSELPDETQEGIPEFIFYATNLQTGVSVRQTRLTISDYLLGYYHGHDMRVAEAVASSSAFPPVFTPFIYKTKLSQWERGKYSTFFDNEKMREKLILSDGGVYDNMGLQAASEYETILVSDAGAPMVRDKKTWLMRWSQVSKMKRVLDIAIEQSRAVRKKELIDWFEWQKRKGTYWGIATNIDHYELENPILKYSDEMAKMKDVATRLKRFSKKKQGRLINLGYALTDTAMRKYVLPDDPGPGTLPRPTDTFD